MKIPATYATKFNKKLLKVAGVNRPKTFSGKFGSTSKYGGSKIKRTGRFK